MTTQAWRAPSGIEPSGRVRDAAIPAPRTESPRSAVGRRRRTPAEIVALLEHADELLTRGDAVAAVIKAIGVSEATFHRWRAHYGGIKAQDARRLRELELENRDLIAQVANQSLDILMLRQALSVDVLGPRLRSGIVTALRAKFDVSERRACEVIGQSRSTQRRMSETDGSAEDLPASAGSSRIQLDDPDDDVDYDEIAAAYPETTHVSTVLTAIPTAATPPTATPTTATTLTPWSAR